MGKVIETKGWAIGPVGLEPTAGARNRRKANVDMGRIAL